MAGVKEMPAVIWLVNENLLCQTIMILITKSIQFYLLKRLRANLLGIYINKRSALLGKLKCLKR